MHSSPRHPSFSFASFVSCKLKRMALLAVCLAAAPVAAFASNTFTVINQPNTTFSSGGNLGVIMVAEENNGVIVPNTTITVSISGGATSAGPYTTGQNTSQSTLFGGASVTPTNVNGMATFDLSQFPLFAFAGGGTQTYTVTYSDSNTFATPLQTTITVTVPSHLYVVTSFVDTTGTCNDVNSTGQPQSGCTLRTALTNVAALANTSSATIAFSNIYAATNTNAWPQTINLTGNLGSSTSLNWVSTLTIMGPGANSLFISGAASSAPTTPVYYLFKEKSGTTNGPMYMSGMTLEYGSVSGDGAALYFYPQVSPSYITNMTFYKNTATATGGAFYIPSGATTAWNVFFNNCRFDSNNDSTTGGGISDGATNGNMTINNSTFINNTAGTNGGALNFSGTEAASSANTVTITNSLFTGNSASSGNGGAANLSTATASASQTTYILTNDTFYANSTGGQFGGAMYLGGGTSNLSNNILTNVTIVGNSNTFTGSAKGGGIYSSSTANLTLINSVVEGNRTPNSSSVYPDLYYTSGNLSNNYYPSTISSTANSPFLYPGLAALALSDLGNYGGATQTLVPMPGSPLIASGNGSIEGSIITDQRGITRPNYGSGNIDAGAVQTVPSLLFSVEPPSTVNTGGSFYPTPVVSYTDNGYSLSSTAAPVPVTLTQTMGTLAGNTTAYMTSGSASFTSFDSTSSEYQVELIATAGSGPGYGAGANLAATYSTPYNVVASSSNLVFTSYPTSALVVGYASSNFNVNVEDAYGNTSSSYVQITLTITGPSGYTGYSTSVNANNGVATFSGLPVLTITGSYTYTVTSSGLTTAAASETVSRVTTAINVSESSASNTYGTQITLTATLSPYSYGSASTNGETVSFTVNGKPGGTGTLASGVATLNTANFPTGHNTIVATYAGDATFTASTSTGIGQTSTPPPTTPLPPATPTATAYLPPFTQNFVMGSIVIVNYGTYGAGFTNSGSGSCAPSSTYGPSGTTSCNVGLNYSQTGGGLQTAAVEIFDTNGVLQGVTYIVTPRYR